MAKLPLDTSYEATPLASESKGSLGAQRIRETRENARYPQQTEANVGSVASGYTNDGRHSMGSARAFVKATLPTTLLKPDDTTALTTAEMPSGTLSTGAAISAALGVTDTGRLLVDTSGLYPRIHYWSGTAWVGTAPTWNGFVNGQFKVNQRTAFAGAEASLIATKTYWFDRWFTTFTAGPGTVNRETAALPTGSISPVGIKVIGGVATTIGRVGQRIEGSRAQALGADRAVNAFVTISGKVRNTGASALTLDLVINSADALDNFAAVTNITSSVGVVTALAAGASVNFSFTLDIGTASAGTPANGLEVYLITTAPNPFPATENFVTTDLQIEVGRVATVMWPEDFQEQLRLCNRFYQKTFPYTTKPATASGNYGGCFGTSSDNFNTGALWTFPEKMIATPTIILFNPTQANANARNVDNTGDTAATVPAGANLSSSGIMVPLATGAAENGFAIHATASAEL